VTMQSGTPLAEAGDAGRKRRFRPPPGALDAAPGAQTVTGSEVVTGPEVVTGSRAVTGSEAATGSKAATGSEVATGASAAAGASTRLASGKGGAARSDLRPTVTRGARWPWWLLRIGVTVQAIVTFLQPVFAGRFLAGDYGALAEHRAGAQIVLGCCVVQLLTTLLAWRPGRASGRLFWFAVLLTVAVYEQLHAGFDRNLGLHIPLGVLVVGVTAWLLYRVWHPRTTPAPEKAALGKASPGANAVPEAAGRHEEGTTDGATIGSRA